MARLPREVGSTSLDGSRLSAGAAPCVSSRLVLYARHGRELMGCKSPVGEPTVKISPPTTSRGQGRLREEGPEAPVWWVWRRQDPRAHEQKGPTRPGLLGESAPEDEALGSWGVGKWRTHYRPTQ